MNEPLETAELLAFAKTVESKSLSRAATELRVPRATISRRLARLEERLGARLLRRTTRSLVLTDAGEILYRHARIVLDAVGYAEASVRRTDNTVRGDLRVSVPPFSDPTFYAMVNAFAAKHPEVRMIVHFSTRLVDLRRDGYDIAIRASETFEPGLIARTLQRDAIVAVASPDYLKKHGTPMTRKDLRTHRCMLGFAGGEVPQTHWSLAGGGKLQVDGAFYSNDIGMLASAAADGLGIAFLPLFIVRPLLESGALLQVLPGILKSESRVAVVYAEREFVPPQVRAFADEVTEWAKTALGKDVPEKCRAEADRRMKKTAAPSRRKRKS